MEGGRTAYSRFKVPIPVHEQSTCYVSARSQLAELFVKARLIIWDEALMAHRHGIEAVDRTLRDLMKTTNPALEYILFGGNIIVFGGDFCQILPVARNGGREEIVQASIKRSPL